MTRILMNKIIQILYCETFLFLHAVEMQHLAKQLSCNKYNLTLGRKKKKKKKGSFFYLKSYISSTENILDTNSLCLSCFSF